MIARNLAPVNDSIRLPWLPIEGASVFIRVLAPFEKYQLRAIKQILDVKSDLNWKSTFEKPNGSNEVNRTTN